MENLKSFVKQNLQLILFALCGILVISGILVVVLGGGSSEGGLKALLVIFGIVLMLLGCSLLFFALTVATDERANFFLYDSKTKSNISPEELDFDRINKKLTYLMTRLTSNAAKVWTDNVFESSGELFEGDDSYIPLVAYKILYDLGDRADEGIWNLYVMADSGIINSIVRALELNEDGELGKACKFLHENANGNYDRTARFLEDNKKYIQNKVLKYVKANINRF